MWPISEVNLGHNDLSSCASGCPLTLLSAWDQKHMQFAVELPACHGPSWRPFQRIIPTRCLRALLPLGHLGGYFRVIPTHCLRALLPLLSMQQLCTFTGNSSCPHLIYSQDIVKSISQHLPFGQITTPCTNPQGRDGTTGPPSPHFPYIQEASLAAGNG